MYFSCEYSVLAAKDVLFSMRLPIISLPLLPDSCNCRISSFDSLCDVPSSVMRRLSCPLSSPFRSSHDSVRSTSFNEYVFLLPCFGTISNVLQNGLPMISCISTLWFFPNIRVPFSDTLYTLLKLCFLTITWMPTVITLSADSLLIVPRTIRLQRLVGF